MQTSFFCPASRTATVVVVVVNFNGLSDTIDCVESLLAQTYRRCRTVVVDNGSEQDEAAALRQRFGAAIDVVRNERNLGCGGGYNTGIDAALSTGKPDFVVTMNNDMVAAPDMVAALVRAADSCPTAGIIGAKVFYHGLSRPRDTIWSAGGEVHPWALKVPRRRGDGEPDGPAYCERQPVEWVSGAALFFRTSVLPVAGRFNALHLVGYEDVEFCLKARAAGHEVMFAPEAKAWHKVGVSARRMHLTYTNLPAYFHLIRECLPRYVLAYQVALLPILFWRWVFLYLLQSRDPKALRSFAAQLFRKRSKGNG